MDQGFALAVGGAGEFVEDQNARIAQDDPRQGQTLFLAARQLAANLADARLIALGLRQNEFVREGPLRRRLDVLLLGPARAVGDVVVNGVVEQDRILRDNADLLAQTAQIDFAEIVTVDRTLP